MVRRARRRRGPPGRRCPRLAPLLVQEERAARSCYGSLLTSLRFFEEAGGVAAGDKLSSLDALANAVNTWITEFGSVLYSFYLVTRSEASKKQSKFWSYFEK